MKTTPRFPAICPTRVYLGRQVFARASPQNSRLTSLLVACRSLKRNLQLRDANDISNFVERHLLQRANNMYLSLRTQKLLA